jgi:hypothetical protein
MSSQHRAKQTNTGAINMKCKDCNSNEGTLLKEFDSEKFDIIVGTIFQK